jgi:flagellar biosynthesis protein FlhG
MSAPRRDDAAKGATELSLVRATGPAAQSESDHPAHWSRPHARTIVVASGKGGVGKSNLAANLAVELGAAGARVLLLDADFSQANLDLLLGLHPRYDLQHVLSGERTLEEIAVAGPKGVTLVPAASGVPELADLDDFRREGILRGLSLMERDIDIVLIDTASGVSRQVTSFCLAADDVIVLTTPEMPAFSDAYGLVKGLHAQGLTRAPHLVVSMAVTAEEADETAHRIRVVARRFLQTDLPYLGAVPFDAAVASAVRRQEPVVTAYPRSGAAAAYRALARKLWQPPSPDQDVQEPSLHRLQAS